MYAYIKGTFVSVYKDGIIIDSGGIGYHVIVPFNNELGLPNEGEEIKVLTHYYVTENSITLYGFFTEEDREMFLKLITVSGIGPKGAISVLSALSTRDIIFAILNDDDKAISRAPGIGPKTAKRMIVDLKDKLDISEDTLLRMPEATEFHGGPDSDSIRDAISALSALGYPANEAARAVKSVKNAENLDVEELLSFALKEL